MIAFIQLLVGLTATTPPAAAPVKVVTSLTTYAAIAREIVGDRDRPVVFIFAGKAHPADQPGQELIREITQLARMNEFEGHFLFVEGYDLYSARRLVTGVDVWLNNPVHTMEASGTSGMKAGINGVINLSVLDGWWDEGYMGDNGWAIKPAASSLDPEQRDREEAHTFYEIMQDQVVPMYYDRGSTGDKAQWIQMAKRSMATLLPRFSAARMLNEYVETVYKPTARQAARYRDNSGDAAKVVAAWKARVRGAWSGVKVRRLDRPATTLRFGEGMQIELAVNLNSLRPEDVVVELVLSRGLQAAEHERRRHEFVAAGPVSDGAGEQRFTLHLQPDLCGRLDYRIRLYPYHVLLTHRFELGLMRWL